MGRLETEYEEWNTPIIGAYLIWQFAVAYVENNKTENAPNIIEILYSYVLLTDKNYIKHINGYRKNFASYITAFNQHKETDLLSNFSSKLLSKREYAMRAVDIAVSAGLLGWDTDSASLVPIMKLKENKGSKKMGTEVQKIAKSAKILGKWLANEDFSTITSALGVVL